MPLAPLPTFGRFGPRLVQAFASSLFALALALGGPPAHAQAPAATTTKTGLPKAHSPAPATKPGWAELTAAQQIALGPLAPAWNGISEVQKRKWIALSRNYPALSATERTTLHGRMTEWAALSAAQRNQARLNFAQTKKLSTEEKRTQWQAYQALSPEQKEQLASRAKPKAVGAAPALVPVSPSKLATVPVTRSTFHVHTATGSKPRLANGAAISPTIAGAASAPLAQP